MDLSTAASTHYTHLSKAASRCAEKSLRLYAGGVSKPDNQLTKVARHSLDVGVIPVRAVHGRVAVGINEQLTAVPAEHAPMAVRGGAGSMGCCDSLGSCILWRTTQVIAGGQEHQVGCPQHCNSVKATSHGDGRLRGPAA